MRISDWSSDVCSSDLCEALRTLIGEGINVNVTLLFSREAYRAVAEAYIDGVEIWAERNGSAGQIASVASFFVSRIDAAMDAQVQARIDAGDAAAARLRPLLGAIAIANARLAYQDYRDIRSAEHTSELQSLMRISYA